MNSVYCLAAIADEHYAEMAIVATKAEAETLLSMFNVKNFRGIKLVNEETLGILNRVKEWKIICHPVLEPADEDSILRAVMSGQRSKKGYFYIVGFKLANFEPGDLPYEEHGVDHGYQVKLGYAYLEGVANGWKF